MADDFTQKDIDRLLAEALGDEPEEDDMDELFDDAYQSLSRLPEDSGIDFSEHDDMEPYIPELGDDILKEINGESGSIRISEDKFLTVSLTEYFNVTEKEMTKYDLVGVQGKHNEITGPPEIEAVVGYRLVRGDFGVTGYGTALIPRKGSDIEEDQVKL